MCALVSFIKTPLVSLNTLSTHNYVKELTKSTLFLDDFDEFATSSLKTPNERRTVRPTPANRFSVAKKKATGVKS